ncbi:hypothetical protein A0O34_16690 [Chryseobacterium glaciei]|uniref:Uncharacterized protein n=1 Tax=Chryseobacterium glaciei TaxID=1685010 RepID=A0A172XYN3_9FLAO|nr:hypothetical protein [Chryseobacterium glaciei]ANF52051.1 hypothetical protein A0O34_16690 [Chryseobacterium glaciei]
MDIKYAYYNTSKGYRVLGGTAAHFLKADGSLDGTSYIPVNTEINMGDKNLNFTSGSLSKLENGARIFNKVFHKYTGTAQTGILSIKFPQASTAATMFDVTIKIFNYQATYLGSIRVAFYKQTATVIHSTGRKCLVECTDNFPSTIVNVGMDLLGNVCINLGDINTVWNLHTNIEVERVSAVYTGAGADWSKGWSQTVETVAPVVPTTYQSLVSIPTEILATRSQIPSAQNLSTNPTNAGTVDISGGGTSASLTNLTLASKSDGLARSMRHELQAYYVSSGSVNYPSAIGAGIRLERHSSAADQRGLNLWTAGASGQIYFKTFNGTANESAWEMFASREWATANLALTNHTHTFASLTAKPTTLSGYGITDAMSTSHLANGITSGLIANWNNAFDWGNHKAINQNQWLGSDYASGYEKPNSTYFGSGKLKLQMLHGNNVGATDSWYDVLWMSSYVGGDVKKSTAIISSKYTNEIGFAKQDYDAVDWGTYVKFWTSDNLNPANFATVTQLNDRIPKAVIPNNDFNNIGGYGVSGIYRADANAGGVKYLYAPMLHMGGQDTMSQLQINYNNGGADAGELSYRGGYENNYSDWRLSWDDKNLPNPFSISKNVNGVNANTLQGTKLHTSTDNWTNKPSWSNSGSGSLLNISTYYDVPEYGFQMYMDTESDSMGFRSRHGSSTFSDWDKIITRTKGKFINTVIVSSQGTSDLNPANMGTNAKLVLSNGNGESPVYGMKFGIENDGSGHIQQQRFDGSAGSYPLHLQPLDSMVTIGTYNRTTTRDVLTAYGKISAYGNESNSVKTWIHSSGVDTIVAGHEYHWYNDVWKVGSKRGGGTSSVFYSFEFSTDQGATYVPKVQIDSVYGNISTANYGDSNQWNQAYQWGDYRQFGLGTSSSNPVNATDLNDISNTSILNINGATLNTPFSYGSVWHHKKEHVEYTQMAINVLNGNSYTRGYSAGFGDTGWKKNWNDSDFNYEDLANWSEKFKTLRQVGDLDLVTDSGIYRQELPLSGYGYTTTLNLNSSDGRQQLTIERQGGGMKFRGANTGSGNAGWSTWKTVWDSSNLINPATQTWVNTNFIPKTHPVYNVTQNNINSWNTAAANTHTHSNLGFLNNIDQWLGVGQAPQFNSVRLMNSIGYGTLALEEDYIGGELGLIDLSNDVVYAGRVNEYLKYGSDVYGSQGLNIHFDSRLVTVGKEITNHEDKVQIAGNISVDTINISDVPTELVLNPLYNTDGDVRRSRNAHIYIVTGNSVRLPDKPILGQRIEIFNDSNSEIEVAHGNVGTMFYVPRFCKVTGVVGARGFIFDEKPVSAKKYDV